jgi:hypothetical protein
MHLTITQYVFGFIGMTGEAYLILIGFVRKLCFRFPVFYLYLSIVLVRDMVSFLMLQRADAWRSYYNFYYGTELAIYILSFGVILDIYRQVFQVYPAIKTFFQLILLTTFVVLLALAMTRFPLGSRWWSMMMFAFEKNVRFAEAVLLMFILGIIGYYRVPLDRNLGGILFGFAFNNIAAIITTAMYTFWGPVFVGIWQTLFVAGFQVALVIWVVTLSTVVAPVYAESAPGTASLYGKLIPGVAEGLARLNAQLSPWMNE